MNVPDYPITELYGCQPGYPLNQNLCPPGQGFHNGIDYGCPSGTPIVVNGVTIGISGATGAVTGPHCHVGKWIGGKSVEPGVGNGFTFSSAIVTDVNEDSLNGKYVALNGDGVRWVYLHMSDNSKVSVGQVLQGGDVADSLTPEEINLAVAIAFNRQATSDELSRFAGAKITDVLNSLYANNKDERAKAAQFDALKAKYDALAKETGTVLKPGKYTVQ